MLGLSDWYLQNCDWIMSYYDDMKTYEKLKIKFTVEMIWTFTQIKFYDCFDI